MIYRLYAQLMLFLATGFGSGYSPIMPGTAGTLVALPLFWLLRLWFDPVMVSLLAGVLFFMALPVCQIAGRHFNQADAPQIVIDEIVAMLLILSVTEETWFWQLAAFVAFRFFDIVKPFPVSWADNHVPGGLGVMLDDLLAAGYAILLLLFCRWLWHNMT